MTLKHLTAAELPESVYHGEEYADYLSGSELWAYIDTCPAEYVYGEKKETQSMITGSAVHSEVLEMATFDDLYYRGFEPDEETLTSDTAVKERLKELGITGYSTKSGQELWDMLLKAEPDAKIEKNEIAKLAEQNPDRTMIPFVQYDMAKAMRRQLMSYPNYAEFINQGACESSIVGQSKIFGCNVKVRPDVLHEFNGIMHLVNYKTCNNAKPQKVRDDAFNMGYFVKEVFNSMVYLEFIGAISSLSDFEAAINMEYPDAPFEPLGTLRLAFLAQSKKKPYVCSAVYITNAQALHGYSRLMDALTLWNGCKGAGVVVDYCQGEFVCTETPEYRLR